MSPEPVPIVPGQPSSTPPAPPVRAKKNRKTLVALLAIGGSLVCVGGVATIAASGGGERPSEASLPTHVSPQAPDGESTSQPAPEPTTPTEPALPPGTITEQGTLLVGTDIKAGTYRGVGCGYWAREVHHHDQVHRQGPGDRQRLRNHDQDVRQTGWLRRR
jgi:hypothetical protein